MRELHLHEPIGRGRIAVLRWIDDAQTWSREANGDYVIRLPQDEHEYVLPPSSVKYERRLAKETKAAAPKK